MKLIQSLNRRALIAAACVVPVAGLGMAMAPSAGASPYSIMNRTECMVYTPGNICFNAPTAYAGDHVAMGCWIGDGPVALGSRKWFQITDLTRGSGGYVPAPSVSNQTSVGWCGF